MQQPLDTIPFGLPSQRIVQASGVNGGGVVVSKASVVVEEDVIVGVVVCCEPQQSSQLEVQPPLPSSPAVPQNLWSFSKRI